MKTLIITAMTLVLAMSGCTTTENPLLGEFKTPHGTPPFEKIKLEHYAPAFDEGIAQARAEIDAIANNTEAATFENTIVALDRSGELLNRVANVFYPLSSSETSPEMEKIEIELQPKMTEFGNYASLNAKLFERVSAVYNTKHEVSPYTPEQQMLLDETYKSFSRSGAALNDADKEIYRKLSTDLAGLTLKFGQNVLAATNAFSLNIPLADSAKVAYMPVFVKDAMAEDAKSKEQEGWTVTLQAPSYIPFMTYSKESDLKKTLLTARSSRCNGDGENDNRDVVKRISELRLEMAKLLGYTTYADFALEERMAESSANVNSFLDKLLVDTHKFAVQDYNDIAKYAADLDGVATLMPWDFGYYNEKYKTEKYSLNEELVKPYFQLENVEKGTFMLAEKLFGITFKPNADIQKYHPDVNVYEVYEENGDFLAVLYMDYFPRASKRDGAWMTSFRDMSTTADGVKVTPQVTLNFNFTKPTSDAPSLLTFNELTTVLHEFGHGLHGMFAEGTYSSLTGTSVFRDFVELPSQLLENWATEKEFLDMWAVHYKTGEKIPASLVEKIVAAKSYLAAYGNVGQLSYAMIDMAWHSITQPVTEDVSTFEKRATERTRIAPHIAGACTSTAFSHIFSGGYSAGYYSYKWAEVLEADAYQLFQEKGIFNREIADLYRKNILSKGGSEHPMKLYVNFRGHEPSPQALIDKIVDGRK